MLKNALFILLIFSCSLLICHRSLAQTNAKVPVSSTSNKDNVIDTLRWKWDERLDAVKAAKDNHRIVYEDSNVRILQVICLPGKEEPVHTHQFPGVMWGTQSGYLTYYIYKYNPQHQLVKTDSIAVKPGGADELNKGELMEPEGPHAVKNTGTTIYAAYRIEYKKHFEK